MIPVTKMVYELTATNYQMHYRNTGKNGSHLHFQKKERKLDAQRQWKE